MVENQSIFEDFSTEREAVVVGVFDAEDLHAFIIYSPTLKLDPMSEPILVALLGLSWVKTRFPH